MSEEKREMIAETGETIKSQAQQAGAAIKAAEQEGDYIQGVVDGVLMRLEAIKDRVAGPRATV